MRRHLGIAALGIGLVGMALVPPAIEARPKRSGAVVRIERPRRGSRDRVRMCYITDGGGKLVCPGNPPPARGAIIDLLEYQGANFGRARVIGVEPYLEAEVACNDNIHVVSVEMEQESAPHSSNVMFGVMGMTLVPGQARMMVDPQNLPQPAPGQQPFFGIDAEGDGQADLVVVFHDCDGTVPSLSASGNRVNCIDYWLHDDVSWVRAAQDVLYDCR